MKKNMSAASWNSFLPNVKSLNTTARIYGCPSCKEGLGDTEKPVIVKSRVPETLLEKRPATPSTVAWTMYQKYAGRFPLYRQEKDWKQYGAQLSQTTLTNWIVYCAEHYFQPMYDLPSAATQA
ncbi:IS66 family transposase [Parablautia muri]|uniref:IS66 family transposase n=1 Tax=Parablautia muri TaxID=2320879 RepID=UPI002412184D|nr:transposase [Parablautia muri]